jgi:hypothetical protein
MIIARVQGVSTPDDQWRALGPGIRRAVRKDARRFRPHPDPLVSAVAARYARWYLDARTWHARTQRLALGLVLADVLVAAVVLGWLSGGPVADRPSMLEKTLIWLVAVVIAAVIVMPYAVRKVRIVRLYRLELANKLALESAAVASSAWTQPPGAGPAAVAGRDVSVRYDRRRVARQYAWVLVIVGLMLVILVGQGLSTGITPAFGALCGFFGVFVVLIVPRMVVLLVRWVLPGRPIVELDSDGVHMPSIACGLPWASLAEVRLIPMRYARRGDQGATVVAFVPRDPAAVLAAVAGGSRRRKRLERSLRVYGTPMSVSDNVIDHSGEQIAAAASAFAGVPVRRY